ncbi:MAG: hypothetical protein AB1503_13290 [Bacillota bacterium]
MVAELVTRAALARQESRGVPCPHNRKAG